MLAIWLNMMINRLFCAAGFVGMEKNRHSAATLNGPPPIPKKVPSIPSIKPIAAATAREEMCLEAMRSFLTV